jgi:hypothetical protein
MHDKCRLVMFVVVSFYFFKGEFGICFQVENVKCF